mmetsp:Transcript_102517/g.235200  ORF Transcript_102517/g.235200 Transcript_102517/m.235200 type:complete len:86 (+) Transcript_102517:380-637(+)
MDGGLQEVESSTALLKSAEGNRPSTVLFFRLPEYFVFRLENAVIVHRWRAVREREAKNAFDSPIIVMSNNKNQTPLIVTLLHENI